MGNTLIHSRWRWILLSLCIANFIGYFIFALMWMALARWNRDEEKIILHEKCVVGTNSFAGYLLLSIESLTTIGFGVIYPTDCHGGWVILTLQHMAAVTIEGALVTAVFVKLARPFQRDQLELFSKKAVICLRDDQLCLIFRIQDTLGKYIANTNLKVYFCRQRVSAEGEELPNYLIPLKYQPFGALFWPVEVVHIIDSKSPLWDFSAKDLLTSRFEILVVIQGDSVTTGQPSHTQTSYLSTEILWGHRFISCVSFDDEVESYVIDGRRFNVTSMCEMPLCSANRLNQVLEGISSSSGLATMSVNSNSESK